MGDSEAVTEAPPPPTWRVHLCLVSGPEGFDPAPLFNAVSGGTRPLFSLVEPEALLRESKDADLAAELKAWSGNAENAGKDAPAELIVRALAARFAEDKAAGIERKVAPPPEAEGEAAKAVAPAEGEDGEEPFTDEPPPVEKSADVYYVLKGFPRGPADGPAMEASGFPLDSLVTLEMNTADLKATGAAAAEAAAADASAKGGKGKGKEAPKAAAADPEADAEGEDVEPTPLSTPELTVALSLVFGKEGGGFQVRAAPSMGHD